MKSSPKLIENLRRGRTSAETTCSSGEAPAGSGRDSQGMLLHIIALVEGTLVSSTYERPNGKCKKAASTKIASWCLRADVVREVYAVSQNRKLSSLDPTLPITPPEPSDSALF